MTFQEFVADKPNLAEIGRKTGHSRSYLNHVLKGRREVSRPLAARVWREYRVKLDPFANVSDAELTALGRFV